MLMLDRFRLLLLLTIPLLVLCPMSPHGYAFVSQSYCVQTCEWNRKQIMNRLLHFPTFFPPDRKSWLGMWIVFDSVVLSPGHLCDECGTICSADSALLSEMSSRLCT